MTTKTKSQSARVLQTLKTRGSITTRQAQQRNIKCLSARICELRDNGVRIETVTTTPGNPKYVLGA